MRQPEVPKKAPLEMMKRTLVLVFWLRLWQAGEIITRTLQVVKHVAEKVAKKKHLYTDIRLRLMVPAQFRERLDPLPSLASVHSLDTDLIEVVVKHGGTLFCQGR